MPHWTEQLIEPPWSKEHVVSLREPRFYEEAAARGGSDKIRRHDPLSRAAGYDSPTMRASETWNKRHGRKHSKAPVRRLASETWGIPCQSFESKDQERRMYDSLLKEMETRRNFQNNVGRPDSDLKPPDSTALEQLESRYSIEDQMTPGSWVASDLFEAGMITPTKLHYVRSHGPVPQLNWETHRLAVFSDPPELIAGPKNWAMDELAGEDKFKIVEMPITFACDGISASLLQESRPASRVEFLFAMYSLPADYSISHITSVGADNCSEGYYATSILLIHVMDQTNDVMLPFGMNGRVLHPDHGYPTAFCKKAQSPPLPSAQQKTPILTEMIKDSDDETGDSAESVAAKGQSGIGGTGGIQSSKNLQGSQMLHNPTYLKDTSEGGGRVANGIAHRTVKSMQSTLAALVDKESTYDWIRYGDK
ncbi:Oxidoreductase, molybdopterin-binding domain-containing protein [Irpex lacteus]|nr:Oxidoreductase, molybdopterin-binding domain-containing protein [Irpex lacteus]